MIVPRLLPVFLIAFLGAAIPAWASVAGVDTGSSARELIRTTDPAALKSWGATRPWLRLHTQPNPSRRASWWDLLRERQALAHLQRLGFAPLPYFRWDNGTWLTGCRPGGGHRLPIDLREAFERGKIYGEAYGGVVKGFELENEPDITFLEDNAETYAAFLKACYLGVRSSNRAPRWKPWWQWLLAGPGLQTDLMDSGRVSSVVMAPLALPPGPYFDQLMKNDALGYTDAFNFHYYGYPEDFSGVYRLFERAVTSANAENRNAETLKGVSPRGSESQKAEGGDLTEAGGGNAESGKLKAESKEASAGVFQVSDVSFQLSGLTSGVRSLPVLLSEYGYGELDGVASSTVAGRVQQWNWFREVTRQMAELRIAGPMAFHLKPYLEGDAFEFGLTVAARTGGANAESGKLTAEIRSMKTEAEVANAGNARATPFSVSAFSFQRFRSGDLTFRPADFGAETPQPWMERIGQRYGGNEATPALAWLLDESRVHRYQPRDWQVSGAPASPVVIDFIAGSRLTQFKRYGGYIANGPPQDGESHATGELVLYNFGSSPMRGRLETVLSVRAESGKRKAESKGNRPDGGDMTEPVGGKAESGRSREAEMVAPKERPRANAEGGHSGRPLGGEDHKAESEGGGPTGITIAGGGREIELAPMARVLVPVQLRIPAQRFTPVDWQVRFVPTDAPSASMKTESGKLKAERNKGAGRGRAQRFSSQLSAVSVSDADAAPAVFATVLRPSTEQMIETRTLTRFDHPAAAASANAALLAARPRADAEPAVETKGRWQVTKGTSLVEVAPGWWRFSIDPYVTGSRRAIAELPLPDGFQFPAGALLRLRYRLLSPAGTTLETGRYLRMQFRTANGNLYSLFPWSRATAQWQEYMEAQENFTLMFYGRAVMPWRFGENRPVALVLECGAGDEPVEFEIKDPRIVEIGASAR